MSMQQVQPGDLVRDEYGNHYLVVRAHQEKGVLKNIQVSNLWYEQAFRESFEEASAGKSIGIQLQEKVNDYIEVTENRGRPIYSCHDLTANKIDVYVLDIRKPHPNIVL
ncbi:hypothetical protein [Planococcus salinarum]|uniref:hypothetical protein n=1 Tax=Planococcus salinarum TaxID=622695 RepID=UPI000E3C04D2|nr:hypothetical protein [Planococcus salinarum]TAA72790.1 hypothetical protein D2909_04155 [Planococcus salinarum]